MLQIIQMDDDDDDDDPEVFNINDVLFLEEDLKFEGF